MGEKAQKTKDCRGQKRAVMSLQFRSWNPSDGTHQSNGECQQDDNLATYGSDGEFGHDNNPKSIFEEYYNTDGECVHCHGGLLVRINQRGLSRTR